MYGPARRCKLARVSDFKKLTDDLTSRAALAAGKDAAQRAVGDLLLSEEEKAAREEKRAAESKSRRKKYILYGVVGLLLIVGLIGFLVSYWPYFMLAGLVGAAGLYGRYRWQQRKAAVVAEAPKAPAKVVESPQRRIEAEDEGEIESEGEAQAAAEAARRTAAARAAEQARAQAEAAALEEQEIDDELAAMKARIGKP